jgi:hypothetical protein
MPTEDRRQRAEGRGQKAVKTMECKFVLVPKKPEKDFLH